MRRLLLLGVTLFCLLPFTAAAATIQVNDTTDASGGSTCTLRNAWAAAVGDAPSGGCTAGSGDDEIDLPAGIYSLGTVLVHSDATGGAISIVGAGSASTIIDGGGVTELFDFGSMSVTSFSQLTLQNGAGSDAGGAIYFFANGLNSTQLNLTNVVVQNNTSEGGGAFELIGGVVTITDSVISDNQVTASNDTGGAIEAFATQLTLTRTRVTGNSSVNRAGGIDFTADYGGTLLIDSSEISGNTSDGGIGGLSISCNTSCGATARIINSTFSGNTAGSGTGAISAAAANYNVDIDHTTIVRNDGLVGGGLRQGHASNIVQITNSIIALNTGADGPDCVDQYSFVGPNIVGNPNGTFPCQGTTADTIITGNAGVAGLLSMNGGSTETAAIYSGSAALGAGTCVDDLGNPLTKDQRGMPRAFCNIGAVDGDIALADQITTQSLAVGDANCAGDGLLVTTWIDDGKSTPTVVGIPGDGVMQAGELLSTNDICSGTDGAAGAKGSPGATGAKGTSCSVTDNGDGTKTISCTDGTSVTVANGSNGAAGPPGAAGKDGVNSTGKGGCAATSGAFDGLAVLLSLLVVRLRSRRRKNRRCCVPSACRRAC